ncbi:AAA family ATPase [Serratia marcescens]|uniref:AAA family ATPase n=1 Tax=Serratia marcescens TaxID=615 RepID=UPI00307C47C0
MSLLSQSIEDIDGKTCINSFILDGKFINLGTSNDILNDFNIDDEISIRIDTDSERIICKALHSPNSKSLKLEKNVEIRNDGFELKNIIFIPANRIVPENLYPMPSQQHNDRKYFGKRAEFSIDYLLNHQDASIHSKLIIDKNITEGLLDQTKFWLQKISPGVSLKLSNLSNADSVMLGFEYNSPIFGSTSIRRPSNVGFGLTYLLPVIVACLSASKEDILLIENPEAHLHPRGQAAMGELLCRVASSGVQVIVETHSDHVLNGVRVFIKEHTELLMNEKTSCLFFESHAESSTLKISKPVIDKHGRLNNWPVGFFDEWDIALDKLLG